MPSIGADLASLTSIQQVAGQTGQLAVTTASSARTEADATKVQVQEVTAAMSTSFHDTLDRLDQVAADADQRIASSDWQGNAREQAVAASTDFKAGITKLGTSSRQSLQEFDTQVNQRATQLNDEISGEFTRLMTTAQEAFEAFARSVGAFSADLEAADNSVRYTR